MTRLACFAIHAPALPGRWFFGLRGTGTGRSVGVYGRNDPCC